MIVARLMGGHSNQLFQYATARRLAIINNTEVGIDLSRLKQVHDTEVKREYELGDYNIAASIIEDQSLNIKSSNSLKSFLQNFILGKDWYTLEGDIPGKFSPRINQLGNNVVLQGDFQSEKYFIEIRDQLLKDFSYRHAPNSANAKLIKEISKNTAPVSVHIRRGDYVNHKTASSFHGSLGLEYYNKAVALITSKVENPSFYVISDDPAWAKKHLKLGQPFKVVDLGNKGADDMRIMRACKHNIMANSSFSWWGAWLNENPDKIVVAPKNWFTNKSISTADLIPEGWVRL